jgi:excisionase family DNA binding protein
MTGPRNSKRLGGMGRLPQTGRIAGRRNPRSSSVLFNSDRLLDVNEAAEMMGLSPKTLYQWAYERRLPVVKLGSALRFRLSAIQDLIRTSERPAIRSLR